MGNPAKSGGGGGNQLPQFNIQTSGPIDLPQGWQNDIQAIGEQLHAQYLAQQELQNATLARALVNYFSPGRIALDTAAFERMFPGITGSVTSPNGRVESVSYLGYGCVAYSGFVRLGSDVFGTTMTPNRMQNQLDQAWLPTRLDTDPVQLTYPVLGGCIINGQAVLDYNPEDWDHSVNMGATAMTDTARILGDESLEALPILGYRLVVKAIDNHVGDSRVILSAYDTSDVPSEDIHNAPLIYRTTLHMGVTSVSDFTGLITVLPLRRTGLVNLNGSVYSNSSKQIMFSGYSSERLQDYEVMMNVARWNEDKKEYYSDFTLRIDAANAIVYVLPIYPLQGDYYALSQLIAANNVKAYATYLHTLVAATV